MSGLRDRPADRQTYREAAARDAMAGFGRCCGESPEFLATIALARADALIAALEGPAATQEPRGALDVWCPTCHEPPGAGCRDMEGRRYGEAEVHPGRTAALGLECSYYHAAPGAPCRQPGDAALPPDSVHIARAPMLYGTGPESG